MRRAHHTLIALALALGVGLSGCGAAVLPVIPTARPSETPTAEPSPTLTPDGVAQIIPTRIPPTLPGGVTPTPLFGAPALSAPTATAGALGSLRVEFFTAGTASVAPGESVTLYWSTRGSSDAVIYQIADGARTRVWNVPPDGSLAVTTRRADRGAIDFVLSINSGSARVEQGLSVPLQCPDGWFFSPPPEACPTAPSAPSRVIEQPFMSGRMVYVETTDLVYALFNDGALPAWIVLDNRYNPAVNPPIDENFQPPPGFYQPVARLGFAWRGNDTVRNRLALATQPEVSFSGFTQSARTPTGEQTLYISTANGAVLSLLPGGTSWGIITPPSS